MLMKYVIELSVACRFECCKILLILFYVVGKKSWKEEKRKRSQTSWTRCL